jgi:hypothetical protein
MRYVELKLVSRIIEMEARSAALHCVIFTILQHTHCFGDPRTTVDLDIPEGGENGQVSVANMWAVVMDRAPAQG